MTIYYNLNSGATSEMTKAEFDGLSDGIRKKYRIATDDQIALHKQRKAKKEMRENRNKSATKKAETKTAPKKAEAKSEKQKGADDKATS